MLTTGKFYWGTVRKCIVAFGNLFNNLTIDRLDANGVPVSSIRVPLAYAPKQKFLARIDQLSNPAEERNVEVVVPRMAFEMIGLEYDGPRRISLMQQNRVVNTTATNLSTQYSPAPYNIQINLYVYVKNTDDGLQIIEQILPFFNPDFNLKLKAIPDLDIKTDIPIILEGVSFEDNYEGEFTETRKIIWTLTFTLKTNFYGPTARQSLIRSVAATIYSDAELSNVTGTYNVTVDPATAVPGDSIGFTETFEGFE